MGAPVSDTSCEQPQLAPAELAVLLSVATNNGPNPHRDCLGETAVYVDIRRIVAYHSEMSDEQTNPPQHTPDPLTIGELISLQDAAEYAGLTRDSLQGYIYRGRLKAKKLGPIWVTTKAAVDAYLQSRDVESIPKKYRHRA